MEEAKIDVHCHFIPPFYREVLEETGHEQIDGMPRIPVRALIISPLMPKRRLSEKVGLEPRGAYNRHDQ